MTEIAKIVETNETLRALYTELQSNTVSSQLLRTELTEDQTCDFSTVPALLEEQSMKAAFEHLQEFGTPSTYANRFWQNFWVNNDAVSAARSLVTLGADTHTLSTHMSRERFVPFSDIVDRSEVIDGASIDNDATHITINQTGVWIVGWSAAFSFYPLGYGNQAFGGMTTNPTLTSKAKVGCGIVITDGATTRYAAFAETFLSGKHMKEGSLKLAGATQVIKINQGSKIRLHMSRSGGIGSYDNAGTEIKEVIGLRKMQNSLTGGIPTRDASNYLSLIRIS